MPSAVEVAVDTYIRAWSEPDPALRAAMVDRCFAPEGRIVTPSREIRGRAALTALMTDLLADPQLLDIRATSDIDTRATTFRFHSVVEKRDGTKLEAFDAGEVDANGQISVLLTFGGPLRRD